MNIQHTLQLLEDSVIPIFGTKEDELLVGARDLHEVLEVKTQFKDWFPRRVERLRLIENQDYIRVRGFSSNLSETSQGGRPSLEYAVTLNIAMHLALAEENEKGHEIRQYFIDTEKRVRESRRKELDIVARYVLPECRAWVKTFPDEFFDEIYRLNGWTKGKGTTSEIGNIINRYVYDLLPYGVADRINNSNERLESGHLKYKNHQFLSENEGIKHLRQHLSNLISIMSTCDVWEQFVDRMTKKISRDNGAEQQCLLAKRIKADRGLINAV